MLLPAVPRVDLHDARRNLRPPGRAQRHQLVAALNHAVIAGFRVALPQLAHRLGDRLIQREAETDVLQNHREEHRGIAATARGQEYAVIHGKITVLNDIAALIVRNIAIMDEAQPVGEERLLVLQNQRQMRAGETEMPQRAASRLLGEIFKHRVVQCRRSGLVQASAGFRRRRAAIPAVRRFLRRAQRSGAPAVIVDHAHCTEVLDSLTAQHILQTAVETRSRITQ